MEVDQQSHESKKHPRGQQNWIIVQGQSNCEQASCCKYVSSILIGIEALVKVIYNCLFTKEQSVFLLSVLSPHTTDYLKVKYYVTL